MSTLKVDTISEKTTSNGITFSQNVTATLSSSSNIKAPLNATGSAPVYACRAWVNFNGNGPTIRASGNVSSITYINSGRYQVNFTTAMPDANYSVISNAGSDGAQGSNRYSVASSKDADAVYVTCEIASSNAYTDNTYMSCHVFR